MLKPDDPELLDLVGYTISEARCDERDEIVQYLRAVSKRTLELQHRYPWWRRFGLRAGAAALHMAAEKIGQRHRRQDV